MTMMRIYNHNEFYKKIDRLDGEIRERAKKAMQDIIDAKDPGALGVRKCTTKGEPKGVVYAYEINRSYRLLYFVGDDRVGFIRVGDHKAVYGRD